METWFGPRRSRLTPGSDPVGLELDLVWTLMGTVASKL